MKRKLYSFSTCKNLKKRISFFYILFFLSICSNGQTIKSITGKVINSKQEALSGNALIISPKDSTIISGTSFLEGSFKLENLNTKTVLIKLTSLEFKDHFILVKYKRQTDVDLGNIVVSDLNNELDEVIITSKKPLVKQKADGSIEVKVQNTVLATSTSTQEILSKSPGLLVDENNNVSVFGKGNAVIFINGIRVEDERLSTLSPTNIDKIEIISNPGPRYDAEGNSVINIITKSSFEGGTKGMIRNYYSYSDFAGYNNRTNIDYSYKKGKWIINGTYGLQVGNNRWLKETSRTRNEIGDFFNSDIYLDWLYEMENFSNYNLGLQYNISEQSYFSIEYNGAYEQMGGSQLSNNVIIDDDEESVYNSILGIGNRNLKNIININYYNKLDTLGTNLFLGIQYAKYNTNFDNNINESSTVSGQENNLLINNFGEGNINILSAQLDYTKVFKSKITLEIGGKFGYVNNQSFTTFLDIDDNGIAIQNNNLSNSFEYLEKVPAGYVNFKQSINENTNYSVGFRAELTDYNLFTSVNSGTIIKDTYLNLFPNASFTTKLSDRTNIYFTYASRINRPSYESLNPFVIYQDEFTSIRGNPELLPAKVQAFEIGGNYQGWNLKLGYTYIKDRFTRAAFQLESDPREYVLKSINFSKLNTYFASISKNINVKWWQSINNLSVNYNNLIDTTGVFELRNNQPTVYIYSQNNFKVKDWVTLYVTGWYLGNVQDGIYFRKNQSTFNIGFEKTFFNNTLKCNLDFNDIFHNIRADGNYRSGITDIIFFNTFNTKYTRFSISYNFGKLKKSNYKNKKVGENETERTQ